MYAALLTLNLTVQAPAVAISVRGAVEVDTGTASRPVHRFDAIEEGARIRTGEDGSVQLRMASGSLVRLGPATEVTLTHLEHGTPAGKRKESIKAFAAEVASGRLSLDPAQNVEAFAAQVMRIPGIGRWTADYMALRVLGHADAFPETDLVLARALAAHPRETLSRISPWRGYAAMLLWGEYARAAEKSAGEKP